MEKVRSPIVWLVLVSCVSLVLISGIDRNCYRLLARTAPDWKFIPDLRITSLLACAALALIFGRRSFVLPRAGTPWRAVTLTTAGWLCGSGVAIFVFHVWTPLLPTWIDMTSILVTGLLAEELLFRGAVFDLAEKAFSQKPGLPTAAIAISAALFGAQHLGYHDWRLSSQALTQICYTTALGVLLGLLRAWSGSLWIPTIAHVLNNLVTAIYRALGY